MPLFAVITLGVLLPLLGTALGACSVFFLSPPPNGRLFALLSGFASGVMTAASFFSLLLPALSYGEDILHTAEVTLGFLLGMGSMLLAELWDLPRLFCPDASHSQRQCFLSVFAVTLHNLPEGMAVGVVLSGLWEHVPSVTQAGALLLCLGIAIQNLPEGAIVSLPLRSIGMSRCRAFLHGGLSGIVEPIAALLTLLATSLFLPLLPFLLAFSAGAMLYVVICELIPQATETHAGFGVGGYGFGFALMMFLDVITG